MRTPEFRRKVLQELKLTAGRSLSELANREGISQEDAASVASDVFRLLCRRAVADSVVTRGEKRYLRRAAAQLEVSSHDRVRLLKSVSRQHVQRTEADARVVGGLSPAERAELDELREAVGLAPAEPEAVRPNKKQNSKRRRLEAAERTNKICAGVLLGCTLVLCLLVAALWVTGHLMPSLPVVLPLIVVGIVWILSLGIYAAKLSELSSLQRKLSFTESVVYVRNKARTEEVGYSQTTYHYHDDDGDRDGGTIRTVNDPGYCASTFSYWLDCQTLGRVAVSRRIYFQVEVDQYYLVLLSTVGQPEINRVFRSASASEFA